MPSYSVRIGAEIFEVARRHGQLMSRSAAMQLEHWARLGMALEAKGLSVPELAGLLQSASDEPAPAEAKCSDAVVIETPEDELWAQKRARQAKDLEMVRSGRATNAQMSWFSDGRAKAARAVDSPY
jgi:hypothetical protein